MTEDIWSGHLCSRNRGRCYTLFGIALGLRISVIVPVCTRNTEFSRLYDSVVHQTEKSCLVNVVCVWNSGSPCPIEPREKPIPVRVLTFPRRMGFAFPCNAGARASDADLFLFANDDVWLSPNWLATILPGRTGMGGAISGLVLNRDGSRIDYAGGAMNLFGYGINRMAGFGVSELRIPECTIPTFFPAGSAFLIDRASFDAIDGFDTDFWSFFEDVDLGWRLWIAGYSVIFMPSAVSYHTAGHSTSRQGLAWKHFFLQRNSLLSLYKNYSDRTLACILPLALEAARAKILWLGSHGKLRLALSHWRAISAFRSAMDSMADKRSHIQATRKRTDEEIVKLFGEPFQPAFFTDFPLTFLRRAAQRLANLGITFTESDMAALTPNSALSSTPSTRYSAGESLR